MAAKTLLIVEDDDVVRLNWRADWLPGRVACELAGGVSTRGKV
jgi:hypothetical protein